MDKPVTIIGFMGSGKTTLGKQLAKELSCNFVDLDHQIEQRYSMTIPRIFELYQESGFRKLESEVLADALNQSESGVISLGGGTPCSDKNFSLIKEKSKSIYLKVSQDELTRRLLRSQNPRPLVVNKTEQELSSLIEKMMQEREPFYLRADHVIESDSLRIDDLITFLRYI